MLINYFMKTSLLCSFTLVINLFLIAISSAALAGNGSEDFVPDHVIIVFKPSATQEQIDQLTGELQLVEISSTPHLNLRLYRFNPSYSIDLLILEIRKYQFVEFAEPNYYRRSTALDPDISQQWFLDNIGQQVNGLNGPADIDIDWSEGRNIFSPSQQVTVAVIDSGVAIDHPELVDSIWINNDEIFNNGVDDDGNGYVDDRFGWDFVDNDALPLDENGHGTLVSSTVSGTKNNGILGSGVSPETKIMPLRILNDFGQGRSFYVTIDLFIDSTTYAANNGAKIINASFGGSAYSYSELLQINWLKSKGILLVIAAGNGGIDGLGDNNDASPTYPASYDSDNIISVAAVDRSGALARFSNFGSVSVDIAAPGTEIFGADVTRSYTFVEDFEGSASGWLQGHLAGSLSSLNWSLFTDPFVYNTWITDSVDWLGNAIDYMPNTNSYVVSPWLLVPDFGAQLEYRLYHEIEDYFYDELLLELSVDDVNWYIWDYHTGFSYDIYSLGSVIKIDLPSSLGGELIKVRFRLITDYAYQYDGAYIDYVALSETDVFSWDGTQYQYNDGTSFSAPIVSGVAALVWAHRPNLTYLQVRNLLLETAVASDALTGKIATNGMVNAYQSLLAADAMGSDRDGDGVDDRDDAFPDDPSEWADADDDGVGDNADAFPNDPTESADSDGDGLGDNSDPYPVGHYTDVPPGYPAYHFIESAADIGATAGCETGKFCPMAVVTNAQLAVILVRAKHGDSFAPPAATGGIFADVAASDSGADYIEKLYADGISMGCSAGYFCQAATVTRDKLAILLLRLKYGSAYTPPDAQGLYDDVPLNHPAAAWIEKLAADNISEGCDSSNYCPAHAVTRDNLMILLARTLGL